MEARRARLRAKSLGNDFDHRVVTVELSEPVAFVRVGLETDGAAPIPKLLPRVSEPPATPDVDDDERIVEKRRQEGSDLRRGGNRWVGGHR